MNWSFKNACIIPESLSIKFSLCYPDNVLEFSDLIDTINYLTSCKESSYFYCIITPTKRYIFIKCREDDFIQNKEKLISIVENKYNLHNLKDRLRNDYI